MINRRTLLGRSAAAAALLGSGTALVSCGPNAAGGSGAADGSTLSVAWWGNPNRNENTQKMVEAYKGVDDSVTFGLEPGEWTGYWDKIATQTAGGDLPDIVQMDEKYLSEYGERGALLDLAEAGLSTADFAPGSVEVGEVPEAGLVAISTGLNALAVLLNPAVFEEAGVEIPDDTTWTWDSLVETALKVSEATPDGTYGMSQMGTYPELFQVWLRQLGQDLFADGGVGFDAETAAAWCEWTKNVQDIGAGPEVSVSVEDGAQGMEQSLFATGKVGMMVAWSNQLVEFEKLIPEGISVRRPPSLEGSATDAQLWYKSSMYWAVSAKAANPEAAVAFVDYLVNSPEAGKILSVERGVPGNLTVREAIVPDLDEANLKAVDFLESVESELGSSPEITPQGGGQFEDILTRACEDMLFGSLTTAEAGQRVLDDLAGALG